MATQINFQPYFPNLRRFFEWPRIVFVEPLTTQLESFTEWKNMPFSFITEDFCHEKPFVAKLSARTARSLLKIKHTVNYNKRASLELADEVKLWFDLPNRGSLFTKIKSTDYIKIQYDHGLREYFNKFFYLYGGMRTNRYLDDVNIHTGLGHITGNTKVDNRLRVEFKDKAANKYYLDHKTFASWKRFNFGFLTSITLNDAIMNKMGLLLGY